MAFNTPNFTQVPNELFDIYMRDLTDVELRIIMLIIRKTKGWNKEIDTISISQFMKFTGKSNRAIIDCCNSLVDKNLIYRKTVVTNKIKTHQYGLLVSEDSSQQESSSSEDNSQVVVNSVHGKVQKSSEDSSHTKESNINKNINKKGANAQPKKVHPLFIPTRDAYFKAFEAKTGYKPKWGGKEGRLLNEMLKRNVDEYGIMKAIKLYFSATDHFTLKQGYDAGYLFANIHKILNGATLTKEQLKQHEANQDLHRQMVAEYGEDYARQFA